MEASTQSQPEQAKSVTVSVWVCPTAGCGNYYAASGQVNLDLQQEMQDAVVENRYVPLGQPDGGKRKPPKHSRAQCPDCRARGIEVERVRRTALVLI